MATQTVNPQNPYVFNEYLFLNQPHFNFNGSTFALIQRILNILIPSMGILSACLVAYMALFQTPTHIRAFSRMILLCSMSDIFYSLCDLWCQSRFQVSKEGIMFNFTGLVSLFSYQVQCHSMSVKAGANTLGYLILPVQYIFRYQTLKKSSPPTVLRTFFYVLLCLIMSVLNAWSAEVAFCTFDNPKKVDFAQFWYNEVPVPQLIVAYQEYPPAVYQLAFFSAITFSSYGLAVFYARRTVSELKRQSNYMSARTMSMQKQIGKALFAQSLTPLLTAFIPVMFAQIGVHLGAKLGYFNDILFICMAFFPLFNSLSTLYFIVPYRNHLLKVVFCCSHGPFKRPRQSASIAPVAGPNSFSGTRPELSNH